jgi:hypothetical protein
VPWAPELFSAPALQRVLDEYRSEHLRVMPFFDGLLTGEVDALVESFSGVPEVHHPLRGRVKGERAFRHFVDEMTSWMAAANVEVEHVGFLITAPRGVEEVILHLDLDGARVALPLALAVDHDERERIVELRMYFDTRPLTGRYASRLPLLQPDPDLELPDEVGALKTGELECCTITDNGRAFAVEYNAVRTALSPVAGLAVYQRGDRGEIAATRVYDEEDH